MPALVAGIHVFHTEKEDVDGRNKSGHNEVRGRMKPLLTAAGVLLLLAGLVWMGQGAGYIRWPAESFMIGQTQWIYYGGATAVIGLVLIVLARR